MTASLPKADKYIWAMYLALLAISVVELYSASSREVVGSNILGPLVRHGRLLFLGVLVTIGMSRLRVAYYKPFIYAFVSFSIVVGFYVLFKGEIINGARRSITLFGILPLQSAELLKFSVVLIVAYMMSRYQEKGGVKTSAIVVTTLLVLLCCGILVSQGLSNTLLITGIFFAMMLIGGVQWTKWLAVLGVFGLLAGCGVIYKMKFSHDDQDAATQTSVVTTGLDAKGNRTTLDRSDTWKSRIADFWDPVPAVEQPITAKNRQKQYSFMAQANGGWHGHLPGNSREASRLPLAFSDYIFAIVVEDWGMIGAIFLLGIYLALLGRAGAIADHCDRAMPALLVMGMAVMVVLQALFHMAIVTGCFPVSGQPLPMISKGGSSILITSMAFGMMLSVSRYAAQSSGNKPQPTELPSELAAPNPLKS